MSGNKAIKQEQHMTRCKRQWNKYKTRHLGWTVKRLSVNNLTMTTLKFYLNSDSDLSVDEWIMEGGDSVGTGYIYLFIYFILFFSFVIRIYK